MAYIDTKYLFKCETCQHYKGNIKCDTFCDTGEQYIPDMAKIPVADVAEVKHGYWVKGKRIGINMSQYTCSQCGKWEDAEFPYCNCGAKMDGTPKEKGGEK